jgi:hypothetical protein
MKELFCSFFWPKELFFDQKSWKSGEVYRVLSCKRHSTLKPQCGHLVGGGGGNLPYFTEVFVQTKRFVNQSVSGRLWDSAKRSQEQGAQEEKLKLFASRKSQFFG